MPCWLDVGPESGPFGHHDLVEILGDIEAKGFREVQAEEEGHQVLETVTEDEKACKNLIPCPVDRKAVERSDKA